MSKLVRYTWQFNLLVLVLQTTLAVQPGQNVHSDIHTLMTSMTTNDPAANLTLRMANALYYDAAKIAISDR